MRNVGILGGILTGLLTQLPVYLVWLVAIGLAVTHWQSQRKVGLLTTIGVVILFLRSVTGTILNIMLPFYLSQSGAGPRLGLLMTGRSILGSLVAAIGWGLIVAAIFTGRKQDAV